MGKQIILKNVRCSFPQLWEEEEKNGQTYSRGVTLILSGEDNADQIKDVKGIIAEELKNNEKVAKAVKGKPHLYCLRESDREEYGEGAYILKANTKRVPLVLNADKTKATQDTDPIYSGCYVNAKVEIWLQDTTFGKRVNGRLLAIQFNGDGESWDGSYVSEESAAEGFESVGDSPADGFDL